MKKVRVRFMRSTRFSAKFSAVGGCVISYVLLCVCIGADRSGPAASKPTAAHLKETEDSLMDDNTDDCAPLFYCPGKAGFYSPRQGKASFERLNAFRNVGR